MATAQRTTEAFVRQSEKFAAAPADASGLQVTYPDPSGYAAVARLDARIDAKCGQKARYRWTLGDDDVFRPEPQPTAEELVAAAVAADSVVLPPLDEGTASQGGAVGPASFFDDHEPDVCDMAAMLADRLDTDDLPYNDYDFAADRDAAREVLADRCPVWDARRGGWVDDDEDGPEDHQTADPAINWANVENALEAIHATLMDAACEIAFQQGWSLGYRGLPVIPLRGVTTAEKQAFEDGLRAGDRERQEDEDAAAAALAERYFRPEPGEGWAEAERERVLGHRFVG